MGSLVITETTVMVARQKQEVTSWGSLPSVTNKSELLCDRAAVFVLNHKNQAKRKKAQPRAMSPHYKQKGAQRCCRGTLIKLYAVYRAYKNQ